MSLTQKQVVEAAQIYDAISRLDARIAKAVAVRSIKVEMAGNGQSDYYLSASRLSGGPWDNEMAASIYRMMLKTLTDKRAGYMRSLAQMGLPAPEQAK